MDSCGRLLSPLAGLCIAIVLDPQGLGRWAKVLRRFAGGREASQLSGQRDESGGGEA
jgi:hypothetical protein